MYNRDEFEAMEMILRFMRGESDVIEHMEFEGQQCAVNNALLAKTMSPSKADWEELGFTFTDIPGDDVLCSAVLPEGWSIKATDHSMWSDILDEQGRKRGSMFYKASFYDRHANMMLKCRYEVCSTYLDENYQTKEIYFGNSDEKLFVAGRIHRSNNDTREDYVRQYNLEVQLKEIATAFARTYYPDWKNVLAYWDTKKTNSYSLSKK